MGSVRGRVEMARDVGRPTSRTGRPRFLRWSMTAQGGQVGGGDVVSGWDYEEDNRRKESHHSRTDVS